MSNPQPIITAVQIREYVRQQNVAPEAAPGLKMLMQAAAQIDQLASAAVQWQDQTGRVKELEGMLRGTEEELDRVGELCRAIDLRLNGERTGAERASVADLLAQLQDGGYRLVQATSDEMPGEEPAPTVDFQQLVDELCAHFAIERYDNVMPTLLQMQNNLSTWGLALRDRDEQVEALDGQLIEKTQAHQKAKEDYAGLHNLLTEICEKSTIPDIRFSQLPAAVEKFAALFNETLDAAGVDGQDAEDLPQEVRGLVESRRTVMAQRDDARTNVDELRAGMKRVAMTLGLTDPSVQDVLDAIENLLGSDNVTTPAVDESWLNDAIDLCHAVAGDLSRGNVIMARVARSLIQTAPRGEHE